MADQPIKNAEAIIEAFGGIRPMAKKLDVAVTTVQGWKKRDAIPAARKDLIVSAAETYEIDLNGLLDAANENVEVVPPVEAADESFAEEVVEPDGAEVVVEKDNVIEDAAELPPVPASKPVEPKAERLVPPSQPKAQAVDQTTYIWAAVAVLLVLTIAMFGYMLLQPEQDYERIQALENELSDVQSELESTQEQQSFLGNLIPDDLDARIDELKAQAEQAQGSVQAVIEKSQEISGDVLAEDAGTFEERAAKLQMHAQEVIESENLSAFMTKINAMTQSAMGQEQVQQSLSAMQAAFSVTGLQGVELQTSDVNAVLDQARTQDPALSQTFAGVPQEDLKAAALLLGMSQFRSALNRDSAAFESDLALLNQLVGSDDPALNDALARLSPHAQNGVLTPAGLSAEFKTFAGDAVVASLSGEDVSLSDRASARINDVFQVEKNGELITGTSTQATLAQTQSFLDQGDLAGAVAAAQGLDGAALQAMLPWLNQAQGTLAAQDAQGALNNAITSIQNGSFGSISQGGRLVQDKEAGINLYIPNSAPSGNAAGALGDILQRGEDLIQGQ